MKRIQVVLSVILMSFLVFPAQGLYGQTGFDSDAVGLGVPEITINTTSGPPGTQVEIKVSSPVPIPKNIDPRTEFFVFLPFLKEIGANVPHNCAGKYCLPLYSFEEVGSGKIGPKTITFTIFSTSNPKPIVLGGLVESVCDLKINGKTIERYGNTCNGKNQPAKNYDIMFGWGIQRSDVYDIKKTIVFTVTDAAGTPKQTTESTPTKPPVPETKTEIVEEIKTEEKTEASEEKSEEKHVNGGCLIATATFGTELAPQVQKLREIRDDTLLQTKSGASFMESFNAIYYTFSPSIADWERESPAFREFVKITITPMLMSLSILNHVDIDSEAEMLGYGISLILLNAGMYFAAPAFLFSKIVKRKN